MEIDKLHFSQLTTHLHWKPTILASQTLLSCLHHFLHSGSKEVVQQLLDAGADVNSTTRDGATPLMFAASAGHTSVVKLLASQPSIKLHIQVILIQVFLKAKSFKC